MAKNKVVYIPAKKGTNTAAAIKYGKTIGQKEVSQKWLDYGLLMVHCADALVLQEDGNTQEEIIWFLQKVAEKMRWLEQEYHTPQAIVKFAEDELGLDLRYKE